MQYTQKENIRLLRAVFLGCAVGALICAFLLSAAAMIIVKSGKVPLDFMPLITSFISAVGSFCAGYSTVSMYKKRGMLLGAVTGIILFAVTFITGLSKELNNDIISILVKFAVFTIMGSIGGIMRVNKRVRVKRY